MAPVQMTQEQFNQLIALIGTAGGGAAAGAAAVIGQMAPCELGKDKLKRIRRYNDWIRDTEAKMKALNIVTNEARLNFIRSCAGQELTEFWEKEVRIRMEDTPATADMEAQAAHTYEQVNRESKNALLKLVNRDRAIMDIMKLEQRDRGFMEFLAEVEDQEKLCRMEEGLTGEDLKRMSILGGLRDRGLAEKAITEEYTLQQLTQAAINRETSKSNADAMQAKNAISINRLERTETGETASSYTGAQWARMLY